MIGEIVMSNDFAKKSVYSAIKRIRELYGQDYPRHLAERKSLISWLRTDVCKNMITEDEIEKIVSEIIGE